MAISLYVKDNNNYKNLHVPLYVIGDLLRDRLRKCEIDRIVRLSAPAKSPEKVDAETVVADFSKKETRCFKVGLNLEDLEPTWKVQIENISSH